MKKIRGLIMDRLDNVVTLLENGEPGDSFEVTKSDDVSDKVLILEPVTKYHKIALEKINQGQLIKKYGEIIGKASQDIQKGAWVHVHNITSIKTKD